MKQFFFDAQKSSRRLKLFFIRGYSMYPSEMELAPVIKKLQALMEKSHDYIDYEHILSPSGLPCSVDTYGYNA